MKHCMVDNFANVAENVAMGEFCVISKDVIIGSGCVIGNSVTIHNDSVIGKNVRIDDNTVIGKLPMKAANSAVTKDQELSPCNIGDNCIIGTSVVIYRGCTIGQKVLVADLSTVRENVEIGDYTIVGRGVAIENFCKIGKKCKLETNVYVTAYSEIGNYCFLAPGVVTSNDNYMGRSEKRFKEFKGVIVKKGGRIGAGGIILPGKIINEDTEIAAGAVVTKDTEPKKIYAGIPAQYFREVPEEELLKNNLKEENDE